MIFDRILIYPRLRQQPATALRDLQEIDLFINFGRPRPSKINKNNKARDDVEIILKGLLFVSSLIAILTTLGIIFSLLFESIKFFSVINIFDYLFGTNWSPQRAFVRDASSITAAEFEE